MTSMPVAETLGGGPPSRTRIGVGLIGFGWLGQAHSRSVQRMPTLFKDRVFDAELVICADNVAARTEEAVSDFGYAEAAADWRRVVEHPGGRRRVHHRAEHAPPRADRGRRGGGQGHLLREAGGRHAGADAARGGARARGGRDHRRRLQLPLGSARALRAAADRRRDARRHHQLPRALLLDVRERPAEPAVVALPAAPGGPRRVDRSAEPLGRPRAHAARPDRARGRDHGDVHPRAAGDGRRNALRARQRRRPAGRGHERGLRGDAVRVRRRRARHVRGEPRRWSARRARWRSRSTARRAP